MANGLEVDASGLRIAAASSGVTATKLATGTVDGGRGTTPSQAGVAAILAAAHSVRTRQSGRISGLADDLSVSSARYDTTDDDGRDAITTVSV
ncbi:type VII secretion target [Mycobacterium sp. 21AC1]|uniref:type VII secretion target n=1 Tax=[Mycobacterium] appelbergii TaxID=2939269 RepID=UPI002938E63C|nr:type VII secretion target [Mycobacterium sp. 21AC1]MDV3130182.1 type VII secretion target [Mycobacterium sp. 21AC1]